MGNLYATLDWQGNSGSPTVGHTKSFARATMSLGHGDPGVELFGDAFGHIEVRMTGKDRVDRLVWKGSIDRDNPTMPMTGRAADDKRFDLMVKLRTVAQEVGELAKLHGSTRADELQARLLDLTDRLDTFIKEVLYDDAGSG